MTDDQAEIGSIPTDESPPPDSLTGDTPTPVDDPASEPSIEPVSSPVPTAPEPPAPTPASETPQSVPAPEPTPPSPAPSVPEPTPAPQTPPTVPESEQATPPTPENTSPQPAPVPVKSQPEHIPEPPASKPDTKPVDPPTILQPTPQVSDTDIVQSLTDEQLKLASSLYAKKYQSVLSRKGVEARQAIAQKNITDITAFIRSHSPANNRTIARALNLPPRRVQHYMQQLTHEGVVVATGWGISREYRIK